MEAALIANTTVEPARATEPVARHCTGIAVWTECSQTAEAIALALEKDERFTVGHVCANLEELVGQIQTSACPAALVDIDLQPTRTLRNLDSVTKRFPDTRFIVLSQKLRNELVLEAMQVGARHFLIKDTIVSDLGQVLRRLVSNGSTNGNGVNTGPLVTVLSASGGCGATTVAVNLANELARLTSRGSLLIVRLLPRRWRPHRHVNATKETF